MRFGSGFVGSKRRGVATTVVLAVGLAAVTAPHIARRYAPDIEVSAPGAAIVECPLDASFRDPLPNKVRFDYCCDMARRILADMEARNSVLRQTYTGLLGRNAHIRLAYVLEDVVRVPGFDRADPHADKKATLGALRWLRGDAAINTAAVLAIGTGFSEGPWTSQQVGSTANFGGNAFAIAQWGDENFSEAYDPNDASNPIHTFVLYAEHVNGIERVEFSVNGGERFAVYSKTLHARTLTKGYCVSIDHADENLSVAGLHEIRFEVFPKNDGKTLVSQASYSQSNFVAPLTKFYADPARAYTTVYMNIYCDPTNNTGLASDDNDGVTITTPKRSFNADYTKDCTRLITDNHTGNRLIRLHLMSTDRAGNNSEFYSYGYGSTGVRHVRVLPYGSASQQDRAIVWRGGFTTVSQHRMKFVGVGQDVRAGGNVGFADAYADAGRSFAFEGCEFYTHSSVTPPGSWYGTLWDLSYADCGGFFAADCTFGPAYFGGAMNSGYHRGCEVNACWDDSFRNPLLIIASTAHDNDAGAGAHPDGIQWSNNGTWGSLVTCLYMWNLPGQGVFLGNSVNEASITRTHAHKTVAAGASQCLIGHSLGGETYRGIHIEDCTFINYPFRLEWKETGTNDNIHTDTRIRNVVCATFSCIEDQPDDILINDVWMTTNNAASHLTFPSGDKLSVFQASSVYWRNELHIDSSVADTYGASLASIGLWVSNAASGDFTPIADSDIDGAVASSTLGFDGRFANRGPGPVAAGGTRAASEDPATSMTPTVVTLVPDYVTEEGIGSEWIPLPTAPDLIFATRADDAEYAMTQIGGVDATDVISRILRATFALPDGVPSGRAFVTLRVRVKGNRAVGSPDKLELSSLSVEANGSTYTTYTASATGSWSTSEETRVYTFDISQTSDEIGLYGVAVNWRVQHSDLETALSDVEARFNLIEVEVETGSGGGGARNRSRSRARASDVTAYL